MIRRWNLRTPGREDDDTDDARHIGRHHHGAVPARPPPARRSGVLLSAARVVTPARVHAPGWLLVEDGRIVDGGERGQATPEPAAHVDLGDGTPVVPGFVDAHVHGGGGSSFDEGDRRRRCARWWRPTWPAAR